MKDNPSTSTADDISMHLFNSTTVNIDFTSPQQGGTDETLKKDTGKGKEKVDNTEKLSISSSSSHIRNYGTMPPTSPQRLGSIQLEASDPSTQGPSLVPSLEDEQPAIYITKKSLYQNFVRFITRDQLALRTLHEYVFPDSTILKHGIRFFDGWSFVAGRLWPIAYLTLLGFDFAKFRNMLNNTRNQYNTTSIDILLGASRDHDMLVSKIGGDLVTDEYYFLGASIVTATATTFGILNLINQCIKDVRTNRELQYARIDPVHSEYTEMHVQGINAYHNCLIGNLSYEQWRRGELPFDRHNRKHIAREILYWLVITPPLLFMEAMFYKSLWNIIIDISNYFATKNQCERENKTLARLSQLNVDMCVVCDWEGVPLALRSSSQGCLNALLASNASSSEIIEKLTLLDKHPAYQYIDLSLQNWMEWPKGDFKRFLSKVAQTVKRLDALILRRNIPYRGNIDRQVFEALNEFLLTPGLQVGKVDLFNVNAGENNLLLANPGLARAKELELGFNALKDAWSKDFNKQNATTQRLGAQGNQIQNEGIQALAQGGFQAIDVSDQDLSTVNFTAVGKANANTPLAFKARRANLSGRQVLDLMAANRNITSLDVSYNLRIKPEEVAALFVNASDSMLNSLQVNGIPLPSAVIQYCASNLPKTPLTQLGFSETSMDAVGFKSLVNQTQLQVFDASKNFLDPTAIDYLEALLKENKTGITELNLSSTRLTLAAAKKLFTLLGEKKIKVLLVANNQLTDEVIQSGGEYLLESGVIILDLSNNLLTLVGSTALANTLDKIKAQKLLLSNNNITQDGIVGLIGKLISPTPYPKPLNETQLSRNEIDALLGAESTIPSLQELDMDQNGADNQTFLASDRVQINRNIRAQGLNIKLNNAPTFFRPGSTAVPSPGLFALFKNPYSLLFVSASSVPFTWVGLFALYFLYRAARQFSNSAKHRCGR